MVTHTNTLAGIVKAQNLGSMGVFSETVYYDWLRGYNKTDAEWEVMQCPAAAVHLLQL